MIVVDTNVIAYLLLPVECSSLARRALERDRDWVAPMLWRSEFRNVLATQVRTGFLSLPDALRAAAEAETLMQGREFAMLSSDVLQLASASRCSSYDCEFVALARNLGVPLVTADRAIVAAFPLLSG